MTFKQKYEKIIKKNNSLLCVGLDPISQNFPFFEFNKAIIDTTHDLVCAYKPNTAFYEGYGVKGLEELKKTCDYIRHKYPDVLLIIDAKRGDIGNTNKGYVQFVFEYLGADAVTLHPYLGSEALQPFLDQKDKGIIILCRTSNSGAGEFQDIRIDNKPLYQHVARHIIHQWNKNSNCLLVIGATYPKELQKIRQLSEEMIFLVPGIGAQGGDIKKTVQAGINSHKSGLIISASRSIIFATNPRKESKKLSDEINRYRK